MLHRWIVIVALLLGMLPLLAGAHAEAQAAKPNIILILADDLDGALLMQIPNVRTLLREQGTTFPNFLLTTPVCCPSRVTILRGQYSHNTGVMHNVAPEGGWQRFHALGHESSTVATWLDGAGYRTANIGRYLNGYNYALDPLASTYVPPGWDRWFTWIGGGYYNYRVNYDGVLRQYGERPADYLTDKLGVQAGNFIRNSPADQPLFVSLTPLAPHVPEQPPPRRATDFADAMAPRTPAFNEADVSDKPEGIRTAPLLTSEQIASLDASYRWRLRTTLALDDLVGSVVLALQQTGRLENTYILFTSDNGYLMGQHRRWGKGPPYEESIRVPLVVRGPGVTAGAIDPRLVLNIDLAPTMAQIGGAVTPTFVDGRSLVPVFAGVNPPWRDAALLELGVVSSTETDWRAVRTATHLYVEYLTGERELYDLVADPDQLENLLGPGREPPPETAVLAARLAALRDCAAASCRAAEGG